MTSREQLVQIVEKSIESVNPEQIILDSLTLEGSTLSIQSGSLSHSLDLDVFERIIVIGAGKATAPMAKALEGLLGDRISEGLIVVKYGHTDDLKKIECIEAGHPVPDKKGMVGGSKIAQLAEEADEKTLCISLFSGGGSALLTLPYRDETHALTLDSLQKTTKLLLECGGDINEINSVRKHLSSLKGGRLAEKLYPVTSLNLMLSDVIGDDMQTIASGPTVPDHTTYDDVTELFNKYDLHDRLPKKVSALIQAGLDKAIKDTPKPDDNIFKNTTNLVIGSNIKALETAEAECKTLGFNTMVLASRITGEAREIAKFFSALAKEVVLFERPVKKPAILIAGGETTVTIRGEGKGGRNQEMALAFLKEIEKTPKEFNGVLFLSSATDGNDGPTDAAGGFASVIELDKAKAKGLKIDEFLGDNNAYPFLEKTEGLFKTGPTNTNVCDIQLLLVE